MAYLGQQPVSGNFVKLDNISVVNGQATYSMQRSSVNYSPASANHMIVSLNGVIQNPGSSYTISAHQITFASNLVTGDVIDFIMVLGDVLNIGTPSDNTVTNDKLSTAPTIISKGGGGTAGGIKLNCENNSHGVTIKSPAHSTAQNYTLTLPGTAPAADKMLQSDGSGNLSFVDAPSGYYKLLNTTTASAASSVVFDSSLMTNTYRHFMITGNAFYAAANNSYLSYRESSDNGNTHSFTGKNAYFYTTTGTNSGNFYGDSTSNYFYIGSWNSGGDKPCFAQWDLYNFAHAEPTGGFKKYRVKMFQHNANANVYYIDSHHTSSNGGAMNRFEIWYPSTTITGTFKLYGVL